MPQSYILFVCKIPLLARRTRPMHPVDQARRATIGYLVYKHTFCVHGTRSSIVARALGLAIRVRALAKMSCIQTYFACMARYPIAARA